MVAATVDLAEILKSVRRPGDYFVEGAVDLPAIRLEVAGVGVVGLPLSSAQAEQLVAVAEQAPYGRGEETVVDVAVRRTWQIDAARVSIYGKLWAKAVQTMVDRAVEGLGVSGPVSAELYKMLVYDRGGFFVRHRDTEKAPGMFATLVMVLPSFYEGGELLVRHKEREATIDLRSRDPSEARFAAFYADCVHEVRPVSAGSRLTLVYNLVKKGRAPKPPDYRAEQDQLEALLRDWSAISDCALDAPEKLIYPLEHAYTPAELGFEALKGVDAAVAGALSAAAERAECDLSLALLSIEENGWAQHVGYDDEDDDFEVGEVTERFEALTDMRLSNGSAFPLKTLPVGKGEVSPPDALEDMTPDKEEFVEATGNEGASFERTYRRACLVVWPRERFLAVVGRAGLSATLPYLADLAERWVAEGGDDRASAVWWRAHELAGYILSDWSNHGPARGERLANPLSTNPLSKMLDALVRLGDAERLEQALTERAVGWAFSRASVVSIVAAFKALEEARVPTALERLILSNYEDSIDLCVAVLAGVVADRPAVAPDLRSVAGLLARAASRPPAPQTAANEAGRRWKTADPAVFVDLLTALAAIDETLSAQTIDDVLLRFSGEGVASTLLPTVKILLKRRPPRVSPSWERLRIACLKHLRARVAEPLEPPKDWARPSALSCSCPDCVALSRFLADARSAKWTLKAAIGRRSHVEDVIRSTRCDLETTTERKGSPHQLVCVKNQAEYDRRAVQRQKDQESLQILEAGRFLDKTP